MLDGIGAITDAIGDAAAAEGYCIGPPCIVSRPGNSIKLPANEHCAIAADN